MEGNKRGHREGERNDRMRLNDMNNDLMRQ
jgi:hypothetical protein